MDRHARLAAALLFPALAGAACQETTTDATAPLAIECTAIPASGPAPLTVVFGLSVSNAVGQISVHVDYGDGSQGTDPARATSIRLRGPTRLRSWSAPERTGALLGAGRRSRSGGAPA